MTARWQKHLVRGPRHRDVTADVSDDFPLPLALRVAPSSPRGEAPEPVTY